MDAALALASRTRGQTAPNPNVGCVIVAAGRVVGRGWTQPGGRPHAEAMAYTQAGDAARGATAYVTLEPCAHVSARGPACADVLIAAGVVRVVAALQDPDPRTAGAGFARLREAGVAVETGLRAHAARESMAGFLTRRSLGRPFVTLKLAASIDGRIALADGRSRWITGAAARADAHLERSRHEAILVGRGTLAADAPRLDVRLPGLEARSPQRVVLSGNLTNVQMDDGGGDWTMLSSPAAIATLPGDHALIEGGGTTAAAFLRADLVDRLLLYRAPIVVGAGLAALGDLGIDDLAEAHGRWRLSDARDFAPDRLEIYARTR